MFQICFLVSLVIALVAVIAQSGDSSGPEVQLGSRTWFLTKFSTDPEARCLDGTPAGYWLSKGSGDGINKFVVHHMGGGWCNNYLNCYMRAKMKVLGSSDKWLQEVTCRGGMDFDPPGTSTYATSLSGSYPCNDDGGMEGLLSYNSIENPLTWNWNKVFVPYCDGASFSGDVDEPVNFQGMDLHFKGYKILQAVYSHLLAYRDLDKASDVIISGSSAGGLAVFLHLDKIADMIRKGGSKAKIVGVPDAGFFLDVPALNSGYQMMLFQGQNLSGIYDFQNTRGSLNSQCLSENSDAPYKCMLPQYFIKYIKTPFFLTQSFTDAWQFDNVFRLRCSESGCNKREIDYLQHIRGTFEHLITHNVRAPNGYWVTKCGEHTIVDHEGSWLLQPVKGSNFLMPSLVSWYNSHSSYVSVFDDAWSGNNFKCKHDYTLYNSLKGSSGGESQSSYLMKTENRFQEQDKFEEEFYTLTQTCNSP